MAGSKEDKSGLISTSKHWNKNLNSDLIQNDLEQRLVNHVTQGNQSEAEQILLKNPQLLTQYFEITDISGKRIKKITVFQYALWSLDTRYMAPMMLNCLQNDELGATIKQDLLKQLLELEEHGIEYEFNGETINGEVHFDVTPCLKAMRTLFDSWDTWKKNQREVYWCEVIGKLQLAFPACFRNEYATKDRSFDPIPTFNEPTLNRTLSLVAYNQSDVHDLKWNAELKGLGVKYAITRNWRIEGMAGVPAIRDPLLLKTDLDALTKLYELRIQNLLEIKQTLQHDLKVINTKTQNLSK